MNDLLNGIEKKIKQIVCQLKLLNVYLLFTNNTQVDTWFKVIFLDFR